jgi:GTP-binding protein HflX
MVVTPEFARAMTEVSREIERQVGVLIDRRGHIRELVVGDARSVFLPDLSAYRRGRDRLSGLRLVHTHLAGEPLNDDDFTDLALLRLDLVAVVHADENGLPGPVELAHLLPDNEAEAPWTTLPATTVHDLGDDFLALIEALEQEFARQRRPGAAGRDGDRAVLVHVAPDPPAVAADRLAELGELAASAGIEAVHTVIQRRKPDPRYVMGKGRLQQTVIKAMQTGAEVLVFDMDLSPAQMQALADYTDLKVVDRTQVILDIFAQHAVTREGKIQVELAQLRYMLPRLGARQSASAFSRLTGGIGGRGPGETKLEIDRRRAQDRIAQLEREVKKLGARRKLRRGRRTRDGLPVVSIVGYTNAGKSTLLNQLTESEVVARNALFATLNPVSRRLRFPKEREVIMTDTVGFIRHLPKDLMAAFRTTLEELDQADVLLHVLDASSPDAEGQYEIVTGLLRELGLHEKPSVLALNKTDRAESSIVEGLRAQLGGVPVSALDRTTLGPLLEAMEGHLWPAEDCDDGEVWRADTRSA